MSDRCRFVARRSLDSASLAGICNVALLPGFGPTTGQDFEPLTYGSFAGSFAQLTGLSPFFTAAFNSTALDLTEGSTNAVDLVAGNVTGSTTATVGQAITVDWLVSNPGAQSATGSWQDSVYLSSTSSITSNSILLGATTHTGGCSIPVNTKRAPWIVSISGFSIGARPVAKCKHG